MIDYSAWAEKPTLVTTLQLDAKNPRIPASGASREQRDLIAELVEHDKVYELAKEITDQGYVPVESLVAVIEDGKHVVLEGNRRLAALKLLIAPESAPDKWVKRFRSLSARVPLDSIKRVNVLYAPTRDAAAPFLMQKHTREQVERWSTIMQARFFRSLAQEGMKPTELAARYGRTAGEVAAFLRLDEMYEIACALELPRDIQERVSNPRGFPAAVLERLIEVPKTREILGVEFDEQGSVRGKIHLDEFRRGYARIVTDIASKKIDTRSLNTVGDADKYLGQLGKDTPDLSRRGRFTADDLKRKPDAEPPTAAPTAPSARRRSRRGPDTVLPSSVKCRVANPRIRTIFEEISRLRPVTRYPNSCAALLRILLELSMGYYLDKTKKIVPLLEKAKKDGRSSDWYPSWKQMLRAILEAKEIPVEPLARKTLHRLVEDKDAALDGYIHNRFETANAERVRDLGAAMEGFFTVLLDEKAWPKAPTSSGKK